MSMSIEEANIKPFLLYQLKSSSISIITLRTITMSIIIICCVHLWVSISNNYFYFELGVGVKGTKFFLKK